MKSAQGLFVRMLILTVAAWRNRADQAVLDYLIAENRVLRELVDGRVRLSTDQKARLGLLARAVGRSGLLGLASIATPDALLRWYRELVAKKYDGSHHRRGGRPMTKAAVAELVLRMAAENPGWGYTRIRGALNNLGHDIARSTIQRILASAGVEPAPDRLRKGCWRRFLQAHWGAIAATDFFTAEVLTCTGLVRYHVFFVIDLKTRVVEVAGITSDLCTDWMRHAVRGLIDPVDGFLRGTRYLIHDRDPMFGTRFSELLLTGGVRSVRLPARSPNLNAFAERFVASIKRECLSQVIPLSQGHLRELVMEYVRHYNSERNHQGVGNRLLDATAAVASNDNAAVGAVLRRVRLGGLLSFYHRGAA